MGASQLDRTICSEAGGQAWNLVYGKKFGTPTEDFRRSKLILAWGREYPRNNIHLWPFVEEARRNGARLVVIDPTARAPRPWRTGISRFGPARMWRWRWA